MFDDGNNTRQRLYRFGPFELVSRTGELRKHATRIRLQEQPLRILLRLLDRPGEIVLREDIQKTLWPDGTVVEFGHGINAAVQRLRNALQDTAGSPRYIETVARRGYRFIGQVEIVQVDSVEEMPPPMELIPVLPTPHCIDPASPAIDARVANIEPRPVRAAPSPALAVVTAICLLGFGVFLGWKLTLPARMSSTVTPRAQSTPASHPEPNPESEEETTRGKNIHVEAGRATPASDFQRIDIQGPAGERILRLNLSPDGRSLVYLAEGRLFVQQLGGGEVAELPGTERAGTPFWSPDGKQIAFVAGGRLKTLSLDGRMAGSMPRTIGEIDTNIAGAWAGDDILIGAIGDGIFRVPVRGGPMVRVTTVNRDRGEVRHMQPQFLPDNRRFLYVAASATGESMLYAGSLDSPDSKTADRQPIAPVESNVAYVRSPQDSRDGFLISVQRSVLVAQRFDADNLRIIGETFPIAQSVQSLRAEGARTEIANFSAVGDVIAYRMQQPFPSPFKLLPVAKKNKAGTVSLIRNWMAKVKN